MSMRVATFAMNRQMLAASLTTQAKMANMQLQEASGLVSTDYGGLGTNARKLVNLEVAAERSSRYEAAATEASGRIEVVYSTLGSVADLLTNFRAQLTALQSTNTTEAARASLVASAATSLAELSGLLNAKYDDRYLFGGTSAATAPVDVTGVTFALDTPDTSYYSGSSGTLSVQVSEEQTISYGINADSSAFEKALRALGTVAAADNTLDGVDLAAVLNLVIEAVDGVATLQGNTSVVAASVERAVATQQDLQDFYTNAISSVRDVDVTAIAAQLTAYETQLQASYAALAKLQSLSLLDYLR